MPTRSTAAAFQFRIAHGTMTDGIRDSSAAGPSGAAAHPHRARLAGLFAALTTPRTDRGSVDLDTIDRHVDLLLEAGVDGICLGGATSEYPHAERDERKQIIRRVARRLPPDRGLLVAIGAPSPHQILDLGACAFEHGSRAVMLPMPFFFRYQQQDLYAYAATLGRQLAGPCLLYDLPEFTNPLAPETGIDLLTTEPQIVGIKDSSGKRAHLTCYTEMRGDNDWALFVGDDARLKEGLTAGWDGSISGLASCCPELLVALFRAHRAGQTDEVARCQALLDELIAWIARMPLPWGIRIALDARGLGTGPLPWPVSPPRMEQIMRFRNWIPDWLARVGATDWARASR
jgi:dihydrodipicolinate synthase/N-acetylneuraminate lyase